MLNQQINNKKKFKIGLGNAIALASLSIAFLSFFFQNIIRNEKKNIDSIGNTTVTFINGSIYNYKNIGNNINSSSNIVNKANSDNLNWLYKAKDSLPNPISNIPKAIERNKYIYGEHIIKKIESKFSLNNIEYYNIISGGDNIIFSGLSNNSINFNGHIGIYHVQGKAHISGNVFRVVSGNVKGTLSISDDATNLVVSFTNDSNIPIEASMNRKK